MANKARLVAGFDKYFAEQFFNRTIRSVVRDGHFDGTRVLDQEINYVVGQMACTTLFPFDERIGSPWFMQNVHELYDSCVKARFLTSEQLSQAEKVANQILITEGVISYGGLKNIGGGIQLKKKEILPIKISSFFYSKVGDKNNLKEEEKFTLKRMSLNCEVWVNILSHIRGLDVLEMMTNKPLGRFS